MKYVRDIPFKEFVDSHHRAFDEDLAKLRRSNEDESVPLIFTETEEILGLLIGLTHPSRILEIGTAYGYSALFFAKKLPDARITTIERNPVMIEAARAAFASRKEGERIDFLVGDASEILDGLVDKLADADEDEKFDFIFIDAAKSHYRDFFEAARRLLTEQGTLSVVIPFDYVQKVKSEAALCGFFIHREWAVKTTPRKIPRRFLLAFGIHSVDCMDIGTGTLEDTQGERSDWYRQLTDAFYIK